jgi:hypothetical protein
MNGRGRRTWLGDNSGGQGWDRSGSIVLEVGFQLDSLIRSLHMPLTWHVYSIRTSAEPYLRSLLCNSQTACTRMATCPRRRIQRREIPSATLNPLHFPYCCTFQDASGRNPASGDKIPIWPYENLWDNCRTPKCNRQHVLFLNENISVRFFFNS